VPRFAVPEGVRAYAVGDIHGHLTLLDEIQAQIDADIAGAPARTVVEIYLGDYIDRGPDSAGVIARLLEGRPHRTVFLRGNHEDYPQRVMGGQDVVKAWMRVGGDTTLASYGLDPRLARRPGDLRTALLDAVPEAHRGFLKRLSLAYRLGDVLFVHAGVRPGVPLDAQSRVDLLTIRGDFIADDPPMPVRVVHGHTPHRTPQMTPYRIGIDTGAFATGCLTCAVLEDADVRFLST